MGLLQNSYSRIDPSTSTSRRGFLSNAGATASLAVGGALSSAIAFKPPNAAHAVVPITDKDAESGNIIGSGGMSPRKVRPPSKDKVPRQNLALDFAVMLTRSSYIEAAQLEIIPVNQLERDLYLVRTAEYQPYVKAAAASNSGSTVVRQGDLTDPYYFDFMSGVQYMTINRAMHDPEKDYDQLEPIMNDDGTQSTNFNKVSIHRALPDEMLIPTYDARVGSTILSYMKDTYKGSGIGLPHIDEPRPGNTALLETFSQLIKLFLINGFAWEGKVDLVSSSSTSTFCFNLQNPATVWSSQIVAKSPVRNDFLRKTVVQLVKSMGYNVVSSSVKLHGNSELTYLTIN